MKETRIVREALMNSEILTRRQKRGHFHMTASQLEKVRHGTCVGWGSRIFKSA